MAQINKPSEHFNTKLYSGNGSTQSITSVGFKPDFTWIKARSGTYATENHNIYDSTRGVNKMLIPNGTSGDSTDPNSITSFDTDGFSMGTRTDINGSSTEYVSWNWKATGGTTSSNTDGSITSTVQANTTAGFSIVSYVGTGANATVGHGLSATPKMVIIKSRDSTYGWRSYHASLGATKYILINDIAVPTTASNYMNDTEPTSSVFSLGNGTTPNNSGDNYIAYCFAEKKGYSKFGSYTGNASADGTFIYLGFKPSFFVARRTDSGNNWTTYDNKRSDGFNPNTDTTIFNDSSAEITNTTNDVCDFLSNGVKMRCSNNGSNGSGTYVYMAFAEQPLVGTNNIPATGR